MLRYPCDAWQVSKYSSPFPMLAPSLIKCLAETVATTVKGPERDAVRSLSFSTGDENEFSHTFTPPNSFLTCRETSSLLACFKWDVEWELVIYRTILEQHLHIAYTKADIIACVLAKVRNVLVYPLIDLPHKGSGVCLPGAKRREHGLDHPFLSSAKVKERL